MNGFIYSYPTKNYFGCGCVKENLPKVLSSYGKKVMLAFGGGSIRKNGIYEEISSILEDAGKSVIEFSGIMPNPTYAKVQEGAALAKEKKIDLMIAVGGGSVIDCCKIVSAQAKLEEDIWEMEFSGHKYPSDFIPMIGVWGVCADGKTEIETAMEGIECLAAFVKEMGLPDTFAEMGIGEDTDFRRIADSTNIITNGCFHPLTHDDVYEILLNCR